MPDTSAMLGDDLDIKAHQKQLERMAELRKAFERMIASLGVGANRARQVADAIEDLAAPYLVPIIDAVVLRLQTLQEDQNGKTPPKIEINLPQDPYDGFRRALEEVARTERLPRALSVQGWQDYLLFKYLADVVASYRGILVNIDHRTKFTTTTVRLDVCKTAIDDRMKRLGVQFNTCRTRYALAAKDLEALGIPRYGQRDRSAGACEEESAARSFYEEIYSELAARRLVPLNTLREYDPALVKALYKACEKECASPRDWLPESRTELAKYNLSGIGEAVRTAIQAFTTKKWRTGSPEAV